MKIVIEKNLVHLSPEREDETVEVERLWCLLIDCVNATRKLAPVGEYVPLKDNTASFFIEGLKGNPESPSSNVVLDRDGRVCCFICNKFLDLKAGDRSPLCCGQPMELMD